MLEVESVGVCPHCAKAEPRKVTREAGCRTRTAMENAAIIRAVDHALVAQGLLIWAQIEPAAAPGLLKVADHHRARAARLVDELQERASRVAADRRAPPVHHRGLETFGEGQGR